MVDTTLCKHACQYTGLDKHLSAISTVCRRAAALWLMAGLVGFAAGAPAASDHGAQPFPPVSLAGQVPIKLICQPGVAGRQRASFGMPFPRGFVVDTGHIRLETSAGGEVAADVVALAQWRHFSKPVIDGASVRSVLITLQHDCHGQEPVDYTIRWGLARTLSLNSGVTPENVAERTWAAQAPPLRFEHPQTDNYNSDDEPATILEPRVWVELPTTWLMQLNLRGPVAPVRTRISREWHHGFMSTYVNDVAADVLRFESKDNGQGLIDWRTEFEGWLYDRPAVIWNAYVQTGDAKWLRHAHRASQFYASQIDVNGTRGSFAKRPGDPKYAHAGGLFIAYLLTGDARLLDRIRAIAELVATVNTRLPPFERTTGLWTERQVSVALGGALVAWEATGLAAYRDRVLRIVSGMRADVAAPPAGYPGSAAMAGVLLHRPEVHEEGSFPDVVMSPWMSALMMEALWRYFLHSDDLNALEMLDSYARFVAQRAIVQEGTSWVPRYLTGLKGSYGGAEAEHAFDVMGLLARGRWAGLRLGRPNSLVDAQIERLRATADATFSGWVRTTPGLPRFRAAPTRKIGWWYGTTYDLAWFGFD